MGVSEPDVFTTPIPIRFRTQRPVHTILERTRSWKQPRIWTTKQSISPTVQSNYTTLRQINRPIVKRVRVQPGTIVMMNSTYLKEAYILNGKAKTFHKALLMDYFELSENEMNEMGMSVIAWGFSYQVKDKPSARPD